MTNPPYDRAAAFVAQALRLTRPASQVSLLLHHKFDTGGSDRRQSLFRDNPAFACKLVLTRRPYWVAERTASPRFSYAWYCWDHANRHPPATLWGR